VSSFIDSVLVRSTAYSPLVGLALRSVLRNIVIPVAIAIVAQIGFGVPELLGYVLAFAALVILNAPGVLRRRRIDPIAAVALLNLLLSVGLPILGVHGALARQGVFYALLAIAGFASYIAGPRPLSFYLGRQLLASGDRLTQARYDAAWQFPGGRRIHRLVNLVWALAFTAQSVVAIGSPMVLQAQLAAIVAPVILVGILLATLCWTVVYVRSQEQRFAALDRTASFESHLTAEARSALA
jgi:hypothetical protein